jgi:hypothetical protein
MWWKIWWIKKRKNIMVEGEKLKKILKYLNTYKCEWCM